MNEIKETQFIPDEYKYFRVRRYSGRRGGSNYYHHADIVCKDENILQYLIDNELITNWRQVDRFDESNEDYTEYKILGELEYYHLRKYKTYILK